MVFLLLEFVETQIGLLFPILGAMIVFVSLIYLFLGVRSIIAARKMRNESGSTAAPNRSNITYKGLEVWLIALLLVFAIFYTGVAVGNMNYIAVFVVRGK